MFEVGPARDQPVAFYGKEYVRVGSSKTELHNHPEKARALWTRGSDWTPVSFCSTRAMRCAALRFLPINVSSVSARSVANPGSTRNNAMKLRVSSPAQPGRFVSVSAGEQSSLSAAGAAAATPADPHASDWLRGVLYASALRLDAFAAELGRYRQGILRWCHIEEHNGLHRSNAEILAEIAKLEG